MKSIQKTVFIAFDGAEFETAGECRNHERDQAPKRLVGLTWEQVHAACNRDDPDLAEAIEHVGNRIAELRRQSGDLKRRRAGRLIEHVRAEKAAEAAADPDFREVDEDAEGHADGLDAARERDATGSESDATD